MFLNSWIHLIAFAEFTDIVCAQGAQADSLLKSPVIVIYKNGMSANKITLSSFVGLESRDSTYPSGVNCISVKISSADRWWLLLLLLLLVVDVCVYMYIRSPQGNMAQHW